MLKNIFRLTILLQFLAIALVVITPVISVNKLLYPTRIDSAFVNMQQLQFQKMKEASKSDTSAIFLYSPSQLQINFTELEFPMPDSIKLRGWMAIDTTKMISPLLLIIPDMLEGAIDYIPAMQEFSARGFNVGVINLRGQGNSDGEYYLPGQKSVDDLIRIIPELRALPYVNHVAILGSGSGAGIAVSILSDTSIADVLILQNPVTNFERFFKSHAQSEWRITVPFLLPAIIRSYEKQTGINVAAYKYDKMIENLMLPQMFVTANFNSKEQITETVAMYDASTYFKKQLYIETQSYLKRPGTNNSKIYYDKISAFINSSLPYKSKKVSRKKLAAAWIKD